MTDLAAVAGPAAPPSSDEDYRRLIGIRARLARVALAASQEQIATKAGLTRNFVSSVERGAVGLDACRLRLLADGLGINPAWMLALTDHPTRPTDRTPGQPHDVVAPGQRSAPCHRQDDSRAAGRCWPVEDEPEL
jgi:transcriptional regulator with XRE-family HTH domain